MLLYHIKFIKTVKIMGAQTNIENRLISYLDRNEIPYAIDTNPSEAKVARLKLAIARKTELLNNAIQTYNSVFGI